MYEFNVEVVFFFVQNNLHFCSCPENNDSIMIEAIAAVLGYFFPSMVYAMNRIRYIDNENGYLFVIDRFQWKCVLGFFCHWWKIALLIRNKLCARAECGVDYFTIAAYRLHFRVVNLHSLFADRSKIIIKYLDLKPHRWKLFGYWHMFTSCLHT